MKKVISIIIVLILVVLAVWLNRQREERVFFVGDLNFDRYIRQIAGWEGEDFIFSCIGDFLQTADLVVGNLEGPITGNASISLGSKVGSPENFTFTFPTTTASTLKKHNIRLVNLGNNHIDDFGEKGMLSTRDYLAKAGIAYFGGFGGNEPLVRRRVGNTDISFISYNQFGGESPVKVAQKIKAERELDRTVLVYTHWGEEYVDPTSHMKETAKLFAEAGAKMVIGSHPHVILSSEKIGDTTVYYSLGNFIFDQYWNKEVSTGLLLELNIKNGEIRVVEHRVVMNIDGRTCLEGV